MRDLFLFPECIMSERHAASRFDGRTRALVALLTGLGAIVSPSSSALEDTLSKALHRSEPSSSASSSTSSLSTEKVELSSP